MSGREKVREFELEKDGILTRLRQLNSDMLRFALDQGDPNAMLKQYKRNEVEIAALSSKLINSLDKLTMSKCCMFNMYGREEK